MQLSLDCMTITNATPVELIRSARAAGFDLVTLWMQPPSRFPDQLVTPAMARDCLTALSETGVGVQALEAFDLTSMQDIDSYRPALELGARLGAKGAVAIHARNPDRVEVADLLARFAGLADECGLEINLEPIAMCQTATLAQAQDLIRAAGVDAGIVLDIYHLVRAGGGTGDISAVKPGLIRHIQLNDGAASPSTETIYLEATQERPYPGDGVFPLIDLLSVAPTDISWGIESPSRRRAENGMSAEMQAREAIAAMRRVIAAVRTIPAA
jgi:sugar phosphate isomerase/epimerase